VILDPTNQYIAMILSQCDLSGKVILEIGCGQGRITRDLADHAQRVVASDPDAASLEAARRAIAANNVEFVPAPTGVPDLPAMSFDMVIYTLSLHHVPVAEMTDSLNQAAALLKKDGVIMVIEPGESGSFTLAKEQYGAGSGDERPAKEAAIRAMCTLDGWAMEETINFYTQFQFDNDQDFFTKMLPGSARHPHSFLEEVRRFLEQHRTQGGIVLTAERRLHVLRRAA